MLILFAEGIVWHRVGVLNIDNISSYLDPSLAVKIIIHKHHGHLPELNNAHEGSKSYCGVRVYIADSSIIYCSNGWKLKICYKIHVI